MEDYFSSSAPYNKNTNDCTGTCACGNAGESHSSHNHSNPLKHHNDFLKSEKNLKSAFILTLIILVTEFVGALISGSMALYSDSGHILVDASSLLLAWYAQKQVKKSPTEKNTYGYHRMGIIAALLNAAVLLVVSIILVYESYLRLIHPKSVDSKLMILFAFISLTVNIIIGLKLHRETHDNLNVKSAFFHIMGDSLISLTIIAAGIVILLYKFNYIDPIVGMAVSPIIAVGAITVINETLNILLEAVPKEIDFAKVKKEIGKIAGVEDVHDLHIWSMSKSFVLLSAHVLVDPSISKSSDLCCIINNIQDMLGKKFNINHAVIQPEFKICDMAGGFCIHQNP